MKMTFAPPAMPACSAIQPGVATHHLDDECAVVRLGRGVQAVDRLGRDVDRGVEAERVVGGRQVVVDGLGHADDMHAAGEQLGRNAEGVFATDSDERIDAELVEVGRDRLEPAVDLGRVGARRAEDRATARQDAPNLRDAERRGLTVDRAAPAVAKSDEVVAVLLDALADDGTDHRVQAGAVTTACEYSDAHLRRTSSTVP